MTALYDIDTDVGKVRLIIGDTDVTPETDAVFTDEEITYFLTANSNNISLASATALEAWAAKYTTKADSEKIGDYSYAQSIARKMLDLAAKLRGQESGIPAMGIASMDLTAGSAITGEED